MTYIVTARKWRPGTFDDIVGQEHITQTLKNAISSGRIAHAYLFSGTRGVGKTTTARVLSMALNCENGPTIAPCNQCLTCREIMAGHSVDVIEIDGASNRGIDEIRELREHVRYAAARGQYKVYIIDEVHMLTKEAFNALLKTLEEPPSHIIFIFATTEVERVPITILSRCQTFEFRQLSLGEIAERLKLIASQEEIEIDEESLILISRRAEGSLRDAQSLIDQVRTFSGGKITKDQTISVLGLFDHDILKRFFHALFEKNAGEVLGMMKQFLMGGSDPRGFCKELMEYVRNLVVAKVASDPYALIEHSAPEVDEMRKVADELTFEDLDRCFHILSKTEEEMKFSSQPRLILEMAALRMIQLKPLHPIDDILKKIEQLQRGETPRAKPLQSSLSSQKVSPKLPELLEEEELKREMPQSDSVSEIASTDEPASLWQKIIGEVKRKRMRLGTFLELGQMVRLEEETLEIGFPSNGAFHRQHIEDPEPLQLIEQIAGEIIGRKLKVKVVEIPPPGQSLEEGGIQGNQNRDEISVGDDIVREALHIFGGQVIEDRVVVREAPTEVLEEGSSSLMEG